MRAVPKGQWRWVVTGLAIVLVTLLGGVTVLAATLTGSDEPAVAHERPRPPLPEGSETPGQEGAEESAVAMAAELEAVPLRTGGTCPADRLDVSWDGPGDDYRRGGSKAQDTRAGRHLLNVPRRPCQTAITTDRAVGLREREQRGHLYPPLPGCSFLCKAAAGARRTRLTLCARR